MTDETANSYGLSVASPRLGQARPDTGRVVPSDPPKEETAPVAMIDRLKCTKPEGECTCTDPAEAWPCRFSTFHYDPAAMIGAPCDPTSFVVPAGSVITIADLKPPAIYVGDTKVAESMEQACEQLRTFGVFQACAAPGIVYDFSSETEERDGRFLITITATPRKA